MLDIKTYKLDKKRSSSPVHLCLYISFHDYILSDENRYLSVEKLSYKKSTKFNQLQQSVNAKSKLLNLI